MVEVVVTGIGLRSCLGSLAQTWQKICQRETGLRLQQPFPDFSPLPLGLIKATPSSLSELVPILVKEALADAQLTAPLGDCAVVVGSSRACQGQWERLASSPSPALAHWLTLLPQQATVLASQAIGGACLSLAPMAACATGLWCIAQACDLIRQNRCQRALAGAIEAPITPLTLAGFQQMGALAKTGCYPFERRREGLALGEGGAILVLESLASAQDRGAKIYGQIGHWGMTCDASHVSTPAVDNQSARLAIEKCLKRSGLRPAAIPFIHAHGTGTRLNDQREASLIQHLFSPSVAVCSTKGATGHTLGASGAIGAAVCLLALAQQCLPPQVGLQNPEFDLNFVTQPRSAELTHVLCLSFGFGGQNVAISFRHL